MVASIPASAIVNVYPNVINAGGTGLILSGLILTNSFRVPVGTTQAFSSPAGVAAFFGAASQEATLAAKYFLGFDGSSVKPASLVFAQYPASAVSAYLRGGNMAAVSLATLKTLAGVLTITSNGATKTSAAIDLSPATSFSNAAGIIQTALAQNDVAFTAGIPASSTVMTVTAVASGALAVGQAVVGATVAPGTTIVSLGTGTGGVGTYNISAPPTSVVTAAALTGGATTVVYDATANAFIVQSGTPGAQSAISFGSGSIATGLKLTAATGAIISNGGAAGSPYTAMAGITAFTQNFATFMTAFKPSVADMVSFAQWANDTNDRFAYIMWDNDITVTQPTPTTSAGYAIALANLSGTVPIYDPTDGPNKAAFTMGAVASINFDAVNGRTNMAFRSQSGLVAGVTNQAIADQLIANGYNFYGSYATANDQFTFFYPGAISGNFIWFDSFVNQIWLNNAFQLSLMTLLTAYGSIPYNPVGYALIDLALADPINAAVSFGAIREGVTLSASQAAQVDALAGQPVSGILSERGWYLLIADASPQVRGGRGSPPITFFYTDGQSVQKISMNSVEVV